MSHINEQDIIIVSKHIELHYPAIQYTRQLYTLIDSNREVLSKFLDWPRFVKQESDTKKFIESSAIDFRQDKSKIYLILVGGSPVGVISLNTFDKLTKTTDIGYWLGGEHQGKGIVTKSIKALIQYYSKKQLITQFIIKCAVQNAKSNHVANRCGFTYEETLKQAENVNGVLFDLNKYCLSC